MLFQASIHNVYHIHPVRNHHQCPLCQVFGGTGLTKVDSLGRHDNYLALLALCTMLLADTVLFEHSPAD